MPAPAPVTRLLQDLIAVPSVNPAFLPAGDRRTGEKRIGEWIEAFARRHRLEVEFQEVTPGRSNVLVRLSPTRPARHRVLLAPHQDTVGEPNLDALLQPRVQDGRVIGRGACDTKGCVATMLTALAALARGGSRPAETEIVFTGFVDEENAQLGSRYYAQHAAPADLAIVGEPTRLQVITAHKGDVWLSLKTTGRSAHGATPQHGRNAVYEAARIVTVLETEYAVELLRRTHPLLGHGTINVGAIRGGTQPNIVPNECHIVIDRRTLPGESEFDVRREIVALLRRHRLKAAFDNLRSAPCNALETNPTHPLVQALCRSARTRRTFGVHYFCDAAPLAAAGTPSIVFGPGNIAQAHTSNEWISIQQLEGGVRILEVFLRGLK